MTKCTTCTIKSWSWFKKFIQKASSNRWHEEKLDNMFMMIIIPWCLSSMFILGDTIKQRLLGSQGVLPIRCEKVLSHHLEAEFTNLLTELARSFEMKPGECFFLTKKMVSKRDIMTFTLTFTYVLLHRGHVRSDLQSIVLVHFNCNPPAFWVLQRLGFQVDVVISGC